MADDIRDWLAGLGLAEHSDAFVENAIDRTLLPHLTDEDLKALGIAKLGERKRLLLAIATFCDDDALPSEVLASRATTTPTEKEAERRLLTVMFCDLVGSTALSRQVDAEDLREIMRRYQDAVAGAVTRYGGHIAKYLGDGVLAYFGWPQAYEDQAERAIRAGLDATVAVGRLQAAGGTKLTARVGIETGQVVVGDLAGESGIDAEAVSGETPNLAARLQSIASPGQVIIGAMTRRLAGQLFALSDLGAHELKGFDARVWAWAVDRELPGQSRFRAAHGTDQTPLVGRAAELQLLLDRWQLAQNGEGQVVWISGEAGIGKSRLLEALCNRIAGTAHTCTRYQCSPYHTNSSLYPIIQQLRHTAQFAPADSDRDKLNKLESLLRDTAGDLSDSVPVLADLLSIPYEARYAPLDQPPQQTKERLLNLLISQLVEQAQRCPALILLEDAHWIDPTSHELLERCAGRLQEVPILLIVTHRPQWRPFQGHSQGTALQLNRLGKRQSIEIVQQIAGHNCPAELMQRIVTRADGIPLFIEELTKTVLEGGLSLEGANVPTSLQASLIERLDRLGEGKEVAQIGAVIGRTFSHDVLAALSSLDEVQLDRVIEKLVGAGLLDRNGLQATETYTFRHALIRDAAYDCLLRSTRLRLHRAVAELLTQGYPDVAGNQLAVVAYHYSQAGDANRAADASLRAARYAIDRSANAEAVAHAESGLQASEKLPKTRERDELELALQIALGSAMVATKGYADPAVAATYQRARELCLRVGDTDKMLLILRGQHVHALSSGRLTEALQTAEQFAEVAYSSGQNEFQIGAQHNLSQVNFVLGNPLAAVAEGEKGIALFNEDNQSIDGWAGGAPIVQCYVWSAAAAACIGDDRRSRAYAATALRLSEQTGQDFSRVHCNALLCLQAIIRRDISSALELSEQANRICEKYNIRQWGAWARMAQTWARAQQDEAPALLGEFNDAFESYRNLGVRFCEPFFLGLLAHVYLLAGEIVEGRAAVDQALKATHQTGEKWFVAELHRLEGRLLGAGANEDPKRIAVCLRKGIEVATTQGADLFALRCAIDLARLGGSHALLPEGQELLSEIYSRWRLGYDAPEVVEAETILAS